MRVGILLILLQSVLFCAEGRTEVQTVDVQSAQTLVSTLIEGGGEPQDQPDSSAVATAIPVNFAGALPVPRLHHQQFSPSAALAAHPIRGPPARQ
ncbi:hypothetical protein [Microbulbifer sp. YPW1]|uniref:hypothetical protein n=1 Tax=Microbulbifer sp. YPW1 TaxID=2745199 RepID=UPI001598600D|nr:hypothetical protein [Microbulbifer sp. YPW1]QKX16216.1 hypothetical protein HUW35_04015 [Microbulbifer sp. YPW1]